MVEQKIDGWLVYSFRNQNPIARSVSGLAHSGSRRWFCWIPARGTPRWLVHAIETHMFVDLPADMAGEMTRYVGWEAMEAALPKLVGAPAARPLRIAMEYSPRNALPYVSTVDGGVIELVRETTGAEIVSSGDLVQQMTAVLSAEQIAGHRRAAAGCLTVKDAAFAFIGQRLRDGQDVTEFDVQCFINEQLAAIGLQTGITSLCSVNANAADPHYISSEAHHSLIHKGDAVLIDLWSRETANPDDSFADITWTAYCGAEVPVKMRQVFDVVAQARDATVRHIQARMDAGQPAYGYMADDAARKVIIDAGYGEFILHRTGHSLGPTGHWIGANIDNLETQDRRQLIPNLMFTVEPGIYMPDFNFDDSPQAKGLGIRSEINCLMHADRVEVTTLPLQTEVIPILA
ncbi:MAG: M24 family metallopeptidase [Caldilineaceae bacterium]